MTFLFCSGTIWKIRTRLLEAPTMRREPIEGEEGPQATRVKAYLLIKEDTGRGLVNPGTLALG